MLNHRDSGLPRECRFDLSGSHGTIRPWNPPSFGFPVTTLKMISDELFQAAVDAALTSASASHRKSLASSLASVSSDDLSSDPFTFAFKDGVYHTLESMMRPVE